MKTKLWAILFSLLFLPGLLPADNQKGKAIWVVRDFVFEKNPDELVDIIERSGCNTLFLQMRALGYVFYPHSNHLSQNDDERVIKAVIEKARERGIKVYAWLNVCFVWGRKGNPSENNHIVYRAEYANVRDRANLNARAAEGLFLEPNDEANLAEIQNVMKEISDKYKVDGFHLDYFRYPEFQLPLSGTLRSRFMLRYGYDPQIIAGQSNIDFYRGFLHDEIAASLSEIRKSVKSLNPDYKLSIAVKAHPVLSKIRFYQHWVRWLSEDLCDFVVLMNYAPDNEQFYQSLTLAGSTNMEDRIWVGASLHNISSSEFQKRIAFIENSKFGGYSVFSFTLLRKNSHLLGKLP